MGQAWCKEKSAKAQDSKSPLDRVFVRCAHKIYPGLKEDGSCLGGGVGVGGATGNNAQRVTSAPRKQLQRGQSIDSVDRPFHPSEWVDVNLEVACEPLDSALFDAANQRSARTYLARLNGVNSASVAPVPPPRRRRRRRPRSQNKDDHRTTSQFDASRSTTDSIDDGLDATRDSDDEFVELERSLAKSTLEVVRASPTRPKKNRSTSSLPQLPEEELEEEARRPPRHMKTASLPRDASLFARQTPERLFSADQRIDETAGDNSIFKIDQAENVKTSTPVKARDATASSSTASLHEAFLSCNDLSSKSRDSSSQQQQPSASDVGYESRSSYLFAERSNDDDDDDRVEQLSSGILGDALVEPSVEQPDDDEVIIVVVQRSLSNESLPCEMLIEEFDEDDADEDESKKIGGDEKARIPSSRQSGELARQSSAEESFKTPPPTPELKSQPILQNGVLEDSLPAQQLDAALNDYMVEKEKSPEPRIVPVTRESNNEDLNSSNRLIDFHHRPDRRNPFDDLSNNDELDLTDSPPEKPSRLHQRSSLLGESAIEASLIVPTPPRRRHRNHHHHHQRSGLNLDDRHRYNDRLI